MRLSLRSTLLAAFGAVLLLTAVVGWIGISQAGRINDRAARMYSDDLVGTGKAADLALDLNQMRIAELAYIRSGNPTERATLASAIHHLDQSLDSTVASIMADDPDGDRAAPLERFRAAWRAYAGIRDGLTLPAGRTGRTQQALGYYEGVELDRLGGVSDALNRLVGSLRAAAQLASADNLATYDYARSLIVAATLAAVFLGLGLAVFLARRIGNALRQVARASASLAQGDLDHQLAVRSRDELGKMADAFRAMVAYQRSMALAADAIARGDLTAEIQPQSERDVLGVAFRRMVANLRQLVATLQEGSVNLSGASSEILSMTSQQAAGAHEQSAAIAQTTATVAQVKASSEQAVQMAETVTETARQASRIAVDGVAAVSHATTGMSDIRQKVQSIAENILALSEQSQQIGEIIATVNDLADQSNLLALNAAIEASRAGEQGKGFTVVASEIRTLAEQSKAATAQVRTILSDIQRATNAAVMATEQGTKGVDVGAQVIEEAGQTIDRLAEAIQQAAQSSAQISVSVAQHSIGMEQIALAMGNINQATSQALTATRNTQQAAEHLTDLAGRLNGMVVQYQL